MTGVGTDAPRDLREFVVDTRKRIVALERRQSGTRGGGSSGPTQVIPVGTIMPFGGDEIPLGWLLCDGAAVSRTTYSTLFDIIGTSYGVGNGSSTFNLPDLKGRVPVGQDTAQTEFDAMGETGGAKTHTLTVAQMPSHTHPITQPGTIGGSTDKIWGDYNGATGTESGATATARTNVAGFSNALGTTAVGGDGPHNNLQPYQVVRYIISTATQTGGPVDPAQLPPRLSAGGQEVTDWNKAIENGFYWGQADALNAPFANITAGQVTVKAEGPNPRIMQEVYFPSTGTPANQSQTWRRATATMTGASGWTPWVDVTALPARLGTDAIVLYGTNLDTVFDSGWYVQISNSNATLALNYPVDARAGELEVVGYVAGTDFAMQRYTEYVRVNQNGAPRTWQRTHYNGTWSAWWVTGVTNSGTLPMTTPPGAYEFGFTYGDTDATWPASLGIVETVRKADVRTVQRLYEKAGWQRSWHRTALDAATWSPWVLDLGDSDWKTLTPQNGWSFASGGSIGSPAYRIRGDVCYLRGELHSGADHTVAFTLPAEARPPYRIGFMLARYATSSSNPFASMAMNTNGECWVNLLGGTIPTGSPGFTLGSISYLLD